MLEPEPDLLNLNIRSGSGFSSFPELNPRFGTRFSKILQEPERPGPWHHYGHCSNLMYLNEQSLVVNLPTGMTCFGTVLKMVFRKSLVITD